MAVTSRAFINGLTEDNPNQVLCERDESDERADRMRGGISPTTVIYLSFGSDTAINCGLIFNVDVMVNKYTVG